MTGTMQNGPAPQGGMPGPASNRPASQQPQPQYQRAPQPQQVPQQMPNVPPQGVQQPQRQQPMAGGIPPQQPSGSRPAPVSGGNGGNHSNGSGNGAGDDAKKRKLAIIVGAVAVVVIVVVCALVFANNANNGFYDPNAVEGQASYKTLEEIEAERNRQMQEGMLNISIASQIEFENGTAPGTAFIENVPSNKYVLKVTITTDSNGEVVYQSGGIRPDSTIETITLSEPLAAGVYPATATFSAYDPDSLQEVGQAAAKVTLVVKN